MKKITFSISGDASFDIISDGLCIRGGYPSLNGLPLRPVSVSTDSAEIRYGLCGGELKITFRETGSGALGIRAVLSGFSAAPRSLQVLGGGTILGANRVFQQGRWFGGPTSFIRLSDLKNAAESWMVSGIISASGEILTVSADDHRRFQQKTFFYPEQGRKENHAALIDAGFNTEEIPLPGKELVLPELRIELAGSIQAGLAQCARSIAAEMKARAPQKPTCHWCSWYYLYHNLTEQILDDYLAGFAGINQELGLETIQIDAGYFPAAGDWLEVTPFWPSGLEAAVKKIRKAGYRPGIWIGPYMVGNRSRLYREHPEWVLHAKNGKPIAPWVQYNEPKTWGYRDEETYVLDVSHPDAMAYLANVFRVFRSWGVEFFKTDFMLWGLQDSAEVIRHRPGKTSVEYFRDLLEVIRKEIGEESYWLACIAPFAPFIGFADGMRIAGDVGASWEGGFGPRNMIQESQGDQYFNNVWWHNDPDAILLRNFHIHLSDREIKSLALWQGILGGVVCTSAPFHEIAKQRLDLWNFLRPGNSPRSACLPFLGQERKLLVAARQHEKRKAWALLVFNPGEDSVTEAVALKDAVGKESATVFQWTWDGPAVPIGQRDILFPDLAPHDSILYYISETGEGPSPTLTLGGAELQQENAHTGDLK